MAPSAPPPSKDYTYKVHRLTPSSPSFPVLSQKFSDLRLRALLTSPASFSSTHALESTFTDTQWQTRLSRQNTHIFVAVAYPALSDQSLQIEDGDWVGKVTLLGPLSRERYELKESGGSELGPDKTESRWQMTALYTEPSHRGKGLANLIINAAIDFARSYSSTNPDTSLSNGVTNGTRTPKQARIRIMIHSDNVVVASLYQKLGFVDAGKCTLAEAFVSNGDANLLPADGGVSEPGKYHRRKGLIMETLKESL